MRQIAARLGLTAVLISMPLLKASALTVEIQLDRANIKLQKFAFQITNEERNGMQQVGVTVMAKKEKLSPGLLARLHLSDGKTDFAMVPVEETRAGEKVTYWFRIAPNLVAKTRFEFDVLNGTEARDAGGKMRFTALPGTLDYWFYVGDFITPKGLAARSKTVPSHPAKTGSAKIVAWPPAVL